MFEKFVFPPHPVEVLCPPRVLTHATYSSPKMTDESYIFVYSANFYLLAR
jgi:hypothetical protein